MFPGEEYHHFINYYLKKIMFPLSGETVYLALLRAGVGVGRAGGTLLRSYKETPALA